MVIHSVLVVEKCEKGVSVGKGVGGEVLRPPLLEL